MPPLVAVRCAALVPAALRAVTRALADASKKLIGQPMLHDLASQAYEILEALQPADLRAAATAAGALGVSCCGCPPPE